MKRQTCTTENAHIHKHMRLHFGTQLGQKVADGIKEKDALKHTGIEHQCHHHSHIAHGVGGEGIFAALTNGEEVAT